jgi:hypothetical protein
MHPSKGRIVDHGDGLRTVTIDPRLDQINRNAVLGHELVHDEYDLLWPAGAPERLVVKGEHFVRGVTADRLVPPDELRAYVDRKAEYEGVSAVEVMEEFEVPYEVADLALRRLVAGF